MARRWTNGPPPMRNARATVVSIRPCTPMGVKPDETQRV